jgi:serine/threonine-protein kinase
VVWQDGKPQLGFTNQQARIIRFYSGLETILRHSHERLFGNIQEQLSDAQEDKRRLGIIYLVDWILRQSIGKFTLQDAANASRLLSAKIAIRDKVADNVIRQLFELLLKNDYLRQVQNPEDQTLVGGGNDHSPQYEIVPRRLAEMGSSDLFAEGELTVSPDPTPGNQLGNYFLVRELARGGMGHVFEGRDERNGRRVVVKIVASGFGQIKEVNERLKREAKILSKLDHANVVKYYDSGEANGRFFLVMDFIDGIDLGMMLRNEGKLPLGFAMAIALP